VPGDAVAKAAVAGGHVSGRGGERADPGQCAGVERIPGDRSRQARTVETSAPSARRRYIAPRRVIRLPADPPAQSLGGARQGRPRDEPPSSKAPKRAALAVLAGVVALVVVLALVFGGDPAANGKQSQAEHVAATATVTPTPTPERASKASRPVKAHAAKTRPVTRAQKPPAPVFVACDPNITVRATTTTCGLAESAFYEYSQAGNGSIRAYSTSAGQWFGMRCRGSSTVICKADDGSEVRFPQSSVDAYTYANAVTYSSSHKVSVGPDGEGSAPAAASDPEPVIEPDPPADDTSPGENIPNYDEGNGYRVQCSDGMYSQSGGIQGACSGHGGVG
jgi:hypothetical protein